MSHSAKGVVAVVTGGAMGLGESIVRELLKQNAKRVFFLDVNVEKGLALQKELKSKYGPDKAEFISCNVTDDGQLTAVYSQISQQGCIDVVFNNAGVYDETDNFKKMIDINVTAVLSSTLKALQLMRADRGGRGGTIVNVASLAAYTNSHLFPIYGATKSAVVYFTRSVGLEPVYNRTKVRMISVCPDVIETEIMKRIPNKIWDSSLQDDMNAVFEKVATSVQSSLDVAKAVMEVYGKGKSASSWIISKGCAADVSKLSITSAEDLHSVVSTSLEALRSVPRTG